MKKHGLKLSLAKETLVRLEDKEARRLAGGTWWSCPNSCFLECILSMGGEGGC